MAMLFMDSFDHYNGSSVEVLSTRPKWDEQFFAANMHASELEGRFTPGALRIRGLIGSWIIKLVPATLELIVGFSYKPTSSATSTHVMLHHDQGTTFTPPRLSLTPKVGSAGDLDVFTPGGASCSAVGVLPDNAWVYVEFRIKLGVTDGEIEVRVDGAVVCLELNVDTVGTPTDRKLIGLRIGANSISQDDWIDDLYLLDTTGATNNTFIHDGVLTPRISVLRTKADGGINTFTLPDGAAEAANWEAVDDDLADRNTSYIESGVVGASEDYIMFTFSDLAVTVGTIHAVQVVNSVFNVGPSELYVVNEMVISGTRYSTGVKTATSLLDYHSSLYIRDTDPSDDAAWTEAKVDAVGSAFSIVDPP